MPRNLAPAPDPIVEGILYPGEICVVAGAPSVGKTRFQLNLLYGLATGQEGWWGKYPPMNVLYGSQRSWEVTSAQMRTVGIPEQLPDTFQCFCPTDLPRAAKMDFRISPTRFLTNNVIDKNHPPKVVVLDTLITYLPSTRDFNFNNYSDLTKGCDDIYGWAQEHNSGVLLLHHTAKQKTDSKHESATEKILGSQAIMAVAISACVLEHANPEDHTYVKISFMSHLVPPTPPRYFHGANYREVSPEEVTTFTNVKAEATTSLGPAEKKVYEEVTQEPTECKMIAESCELKHDFKKPNVYRILSQLERKKLITIEETEDTCRMVAYLKKPM